MDQGTLGGGGVPGHAQRRATIHNTSDDATPRLLRRHSTAANMEVAGDDGDGGYLAAPPQQQPRRRRSTAANMEVGVGSDSDADADADADVAFSLTQQNVRRPTFADIADGGRSPRELRRQSTAANMEVDGDGGGGRGSFRDKAPDTHEQGVGAAATEAAGTPDTSPAGPHVGGVAANRRRSTVANMEVDDDVVARGHPLRRGDAAAATSSSAPDGHGTEADARRESGVSATAAAPALSTTRAVERSATAARRPPPPDPSGCTDYYFKTPCKPLVKNVFDHQRTALLTAASDEEPEDELMHGKGGLSVGYNDERSGYYTIDGATTILKSDSTLFGFTYKAEDLPRCGGANHRVRCIFKKFGAGPYTDPEWAMYCREDYFGEWSTVDMFHTRQRGYEYRRHRISVFHGGIVAIDVENTEGGDEAEPRVTWHTNEVPLLRSNRPAVGVILNARSCDWSAGVPANPEHTWCEVYAVSRTILKVVTAEGNTYLFTRDYRAPLLRYRPHEIARTVQYNVMGFMQGYWNPDETNFPYNMRDTVLGFIHARSRFRLTMLRVLDWVWFDRIILALILLNTLSLVVDGPLFDDYSWTQVIRDYSELVFQICFTIEMVIKILALGFIMHRGSYLRAEPYPFWNRLDFVIVVTGFAAISGGGSSLLTLRLLRCLRPLRTMNRVKELRRLTHVLASAVPLALDIFLLYFILVWVFAILGIQLFSGAFHERCYIVPDWNITDALLGSNFTDIAEADPHDPETRYNLSAGVETRPWLVYNDTELCGRGRSCASNGITLEQECGTYTEYYESELMTFDNIFTSMLLTFKLTSLDDWPDQMKEMQDVYGHHTWIYFFFLTLLGNIFAVNLILAMLTTVYGCESVGCASIVQPVIPAMTPPNFLGAIAIHPALVVAVPLVQTEESVDMREDMGAYDDDDDDVTATTDIYDRTPSSSSASSAAGGAATARSSSPRHSHSAGSRRQSSARRGTLGAGVGSNAEAAAIVAAAMRDVTRDTRDAAEAENSVNGGGGGLLHPAYHSADGSAGKLSLDLGALSRESSATGDGFRARQPGAHEVAVANVPSLSLSASQDAMVVSPRSHGDGATALEGEGSARSVAAIVQDLNEELQSQIDMGSEAGGGCYRTDHPTNREGTVAERRAELDRERRRELRSVGYWSEGTLGNYIFRAIKSPPFMYGIPIVTVINIVVLAIDHYRIDSDLLAVINWTNFICGYIFLVDVVLKLIAYTPIHFFSDSYDVFDLVLVSVSVPELIDPSPSEEGGSGLSALRGFRLARLLRLATRSRHISKLLKEITHAIKNERHLFIIVFICIFIYTVMGIQLFSCKGVEPEECCGRERCEFDNLGASFLTVFVSITGDGWGTLMKRTWLRSDGFAIAFFVSLYIVGNYILLNLLIAILIDSFAADDEDNDCPNEDGLYAWLARRECLRCICPPPNDRDNRGRDAPTTAGTSVDDDDDDAARPSYVNGTDIVSVESTAGASDELDVTTKSRGGYIAANSVVGAARHASGANAGSPHVNGAGGDSAAPLSRGVSRRSSTSAPAPQGGRVSSPRPLDSMSRAKKEKLRQELFLPPAAAAGVVLSDSDTPVQPPAGMHPGTPVRAGFPLSPAPLAAMNGAASPGIAAARDSSGSPAAPRGLLPDATSLALLTDYSRHRERSWSMARVACPYSVQKVTKQHDAPHDARHDAAQYGDGFRQTRNVLELSFIEFRTGTTVFDLFRRPREAMGTSPCTCIPDVIREGALSIVTAKYFDHVVLTVIVLNLIVIGIDGPYLEDDHNEIWKVVRAFDYVFVGFFILELAIKMTAWGVVAFFSDVWNAVDAVVVATSTVGLFIAVMRNFRAFRILRLLSMGNQEMRIALLAVVAGLPTIQYVILLSISVWFIFAIVGVSLFKGGLYACSDEATEFEVNCTGLYDAPAPDAFGMSYEPDNRTWGSEAYGFDDVGEAMFTLFQIAVGEGWSEMMYRTMDSGGIGRGPTTNNMWLEGAIYYVGFVLVGQFFFTNLFIGVLVQAFATIRQNTGKEAGLVISDAQENWLRAQNVFFRVDLMEGYVPIPWYVRRSWLLSWMHYIASRPEFEYVTTFLILLNSITLAMKSFDESDTITRLRYISNWFFVVLFTIEALWKIVVFSVQRYFAEGWNRFDFLIVIVSWISIVLASPSTSAFRVLRILRLLGRTNALKMVVSTTITALPSLLNISVLLLIVYYIFGVFGVDLFGRIPPSEDFNRYSNFENLYRATVSLYQISTTEGWNTMMVGVAQDTCDEHPDAGPEIDCEGVGDITARAYFSLFVLLGSFIFLNLFIYVLMEVFDEERQARSLEEVSKGLRAMHVLRQEWLKLDPAGTGRLPAEVFVSLLKRLPPPLWVPPVDMDLIFRKSDFSSTLRQLRSILAPINQSQEVRYADVVRTLSVKLFSISLRAGIIAMLKDTWEAETKFYSIDQFYAVHSLLMQFQIVRAHRAYQKRVDEECVMSNALRSIGDDVAALAEVREGFKESTAAWLAASLAQCEDVLDIIHNAVMHAPVLAFVTDQLVGATPEHTILSQPVPPADVPVVYHRDFEYIGNTKDGQPHGYGVCLYPEGKGYGIGLWQHGRLWGPAFVVSPEGTVRGGDLRESGLEGMGVYADIAQGILVQASFAAGVPQGEGVLRFYNGGSEVRSARGRFQGMLFPEGHVVVWEDPMAMFLADPQFAATARPQGVARKWSFDQLVLPHEQNIVGAPINARQALSRRVSLALSHADAMSAGGAMELDGTFTDADTQDLLRRRLSLAVTDGDNMELSFQDTLHALGLDAGGDGGDGSSENGDMELAAMERCLSVLGLGDKHGSMALASNAGGDTGVWGFRQHLEQRVQSIKNLRGGKGDDAGCPVPNDSTHTNANGVEMVHGTERLRGMGDRIPSLDSSAVSYSLDGDVFFATAGMEGGVTRSFARPTGSIPYVHRVYLQPMTVDAAGYITRGAAFPDVSVATRRGFEPLPFGARKLRRRSWGAASPRHAAAAAAPSPRASHVRGGGCPFGTEDDLMACDAKAAAAADGAAGAPPGSRCNDYELWRSAGCIAGVRLLTGGDVVPAAPREGLDADDFKKRRERLAVFIDEEEEEPTTPRLPTAPGASPTTPLAAMLSSVIASRDRRLSRPANDATDRRTSFSEPGGPLCVQSQRKTVRFGFDDPADAAAAGGDAVDQNPLLSPRGRAAGGGLGPLASMLAGQMRNANAKSPASSPRQSLAGDADALPSVGSCFGSPGAGGPGDNGCGDGNGGSPLRPGIARRGKLTSARGSLAGRPSADDAVDDDLRAATPSPGGHSPSTTPRPSNTPPALPFAEDVESEYSDSGSARDSKRSSPKTGRKPRVFFAPTPLLSHVVAPQVDDLPEDQAREFDVTRKVDLYELVNGDVYNIVRRGDEDRSPLLASERERGGINGFGEAFLFSRRPQVHCVGEFADGQLVRGVRRYAGGRVYEEGDFIDGELRSGSVWFPAHNARVQGEFRCSPTSMGKTSTGATALPLSNQMPPPPPQDNATAVRSHRRANEHPMYVPPFEQCRHGKVVLYADDDTTESGLREEMRWSGDFGPLGLLHGKGAKCTTVCRASGNFLYGQLSGFITLSYASGVVYHGHFVKNMANGWANLSYTRHTWTEEEMEETEAFVNWLRQESPYYGREHLPTKENSHAYEYQRVEDLVSPGTRAGFYARPRKDEGDGPVAGITKFLPPPANPVIGVFWHGLLWYGPYLNATIPMGEGIAYLQDGRMFAGRCWAGRMHSGTIFTPNGDVLRGTIELGHQMRHADGSVTKLL